MKDSVYNKKAQCKPREKKTKWVVNATKYIKCWQGKLFQKTVRHALSSAASTIGLCPHMKSPRLCQGIFTNEKKRGVTAWLIQQEHMNQQWKLERGEQISRGAAEPIRARNTVNKILEYFLTYYNGTNQKSFGMGNFALMMFAFNT